MSFPLISASTIPGFQIPASLRIRGSTNAIISWIPSITTSRRKFTFSAWIKRGILNAYQGIFHCAGITGSDYAGLRFTNTDNLQFFESGGQAGLITSNAVFRDISSWYHVVYLFDSTLVSPSDRQQIWVNGVLQTVTGTPVTQNFDSVFNVASYTTGIGAQLVYGLATGAYFDGYISEVNFIDGQALTPASFGQFDSDGNWKAKAYSGAYGVNGFYIPFTDTTTTTTLVQSKSKPPAKSNMSVVGDTKWSTSQTKFSDKSIYFDGTGDYLAHPNSASLATGASNFTIEGWVYPVTLTGTSKIFLVGQCDYATVAGSSFISYLGGSSSSDSVSYTHLTLPTNREV